MSAHPAEDLMDDLLELRGDIGKAEAELKKLRSLRRAFITIATGIAAVLAGLLTCSALFADQVDVGRWWGLGAILLVPSGIGLLAIGVVRWSEQETTEYELELELERLYDRQAIQFSGAQVPLEVRQYAYRGTMQRTVASVRRRGDNYRRVNSGFQSMIIIGSLATTTVSSLNTGDGWLKWLAVGLSFAVGLAAGFTGYFKYRERAFYLRQTADDLEEQLTAYELALPPYEDLDEARRISKLTVNVELIRVAQQRREQQLDQPKSSREDS